MANEQNMPAAVAPGAFPGMLPSPDLLIPREMLRLIPEFNGDTKVLNLFLRKCEYVIHNYQGTVQRNIYLMQYVTSKLTGKAAALISERSEFETYDELKSVLVQHFGDPRSEECVAIELETLKIKQNETYLEFCSRIQDVRAILLSKVNNNPNNKPDMKKAKQTIYDNTSLNVFLYNLSEHMVRIVRLKHPETLEDALKYVLEEVNFQEQYNLRSKMLQNRPQNQTPQQANIFKPLIPQTQFKFGNQYVARPQVAYQPVMRPPQPANIGYRPPNQFGYKPNFNNGPPQQYTPRPQTATYGFRPQLQVSQNGFRPQAGQFGFRPPQFGFRPQAGQFGYRAPQPQGYRPTPLFSNDVSMRTAAAAPQKAPVNEMYTMNEGEYDNPENGYSYEGMEYCTYDEPQPYDIAEYTETGETQETTTNSYEAEREVTSGPAASPASDPGKWCCEACTYENYAQSRKCTMCRTPKSVLGEDIFKLQDGASALPAQEPCGAEAVAERLKPLRISSPQGHSSNCSINKWPCPTCTYENWPKSLKCAMCGAPPPVLTKPALGINDICSGVPVLDSETRRSKRAQNATDWIWLQACLGVVEGSARCVEAYLAHGGDPARALTLAEVQLLNRASAFDAGHTLVHLAIRFQRQEILSTLLSRISGGGPGLKRSPSYIAPDLASAIRRHLVGCLRSKKGTFPCRYINEFNTFALPCEIGELPSAIQEQLFAELLDREAQQTLEADPPLINWSGELTARGGSRLYALWNRSAGDCLPDALCQAACGVFDRDNTLRAALHDTLHNAGKGFYARWSAWERMQASLLHYAPEEHQLRQEWGRLVAAASHRGTALHQLHVFVLAHVLRRPLLVYGVDVVNSFRGEALGYARFQGIYLPLLWDNTFCSKSPLCLGYTRGHFSALVPLEPCTLQHYICRERQEESQDVTFLPLTDADGKLLPVHFLNCEEMTDAESVVRRWVRPYVTRGGVLTAQQSLHARPLLQAQMLEEWLNHYRRLAQQTRGPFPPRLESAAADYCSEPDTDEE